MSTPKSQVDVKARPTLRARIGASLRHCPQQISKDMSRKHVVIGDMHANALKLLHFLMQQGVFEPDEALYDIFHSLYMLQQHIQVDNSKLAQGLGRAQHELSQRFHGVPEFEIARRMKENPLALFAEMQLTYMRIIINNLKIKRGCPAITFLGDELSDRGMNDLYILLLLERLHDSDVDFVSIQSNHTVVFTKAMERLARTGTLFSEELTEERLRPQHYSMNSLFEFIKMGVISEKEVLKLSAKQGAHQRLLSYSVGKDSIRIYTHAPTGLEMIKELALFFNVKYQGESAKGLAQTIDEINAKYTVLRKKNCLTPLFLKYSSDIEAYFTGQASEGQVAEGLKAYQHFLDANGLNPAMYNSKVLYQFVWNRGYKKLTRTSPHFHVKFCHGHDSGEKERPANVVCLDSLFGKGADPSVMETGPEITNPVLLHDEYRPPAVASKSAHALTTLGLHRTCSKESHSSNPEEPRHLTTPIVSAS